MHSTRSASDKVYQLLAHGRWFSPSTPAASAIKTGRHDIAESGVNTPKIKLNHWLFKLLGIFFLFSSRL